MYRAVVCLLLLCGILAGCAEKQPYAADTELQRVRFTDDSEYYAVLITMVSNRSGTGGHSALLINASERVLFDPAGSFYLEGVPERNDVLYGISPQIEQYYKSAHARITYHVVSQKIPLSREEAERAYLKAREYGPVPGAFCTQATSDIVSSMKGYEGVSRTFFPAALMRQLEAYPNVEIDKYYENDDPDLHAALAAGRAEKR